MSEVTYEIKREQGASGRYWWYSLYIDGVWEGFYDTKFGAKQAIKRYIKSEKKKDKYETFLEQYDENGERIKMDIGVNISNVEEFVNSDKFTQFLLSNTTELGTAAFVLQTLFDKIDEIKGENIDEH